MRPSISYCVPTWNEYVELKTLLEILIPALEPNDEIIVQGDQGKVTDQVVSVIRQYRNHPQFNYIEYPLKKDFATFKNNMIKQSKSEYIFQIDSDELPNKVLLSILKELIIESPEIDLFWIPRLNTVAGITKEYAAEQGWTLQTVDKYKNVVNFGRDSQARLFKNGLCWEGKVHERIVGANQIAFLPYEIDYCLMHHKTIGRQKSQNNYYLTIQQ